MTIDKNIFFFKSKQKQLLEISFEKKKNDNDEDKNLLTDFIKQHQHELRRLGDI